MEDKKEYYWILMEKICDEGEGLTRTRLVPRWHDGCFSISHDRMKEVFSWKWDNEILNNL